MKNIGLIIMALIWITALIMLIIALTNVYPNSVFRDHRASVGIAFIIITWILKRIYNSINKVS